MRVYFLSLFRIVEDLVTTIVHQSEACLKVLLRCCRGRGWGELPACPHTFPSSLASDYLFKLLLIGDSGVGKSCLLLRFAVSKKHSHVTHSGS